MKIPIKGVIIPSSEKWIYDWFEIESTSPKEINELIDRANGEELEVIINSPGGDVYSGSEIYTSILDYQGPANAKIVGIAASAASVIAMSCGNVKISPTAQIMIHNVSETTRGDYRHMEHEAEVLKNYNKSIANAYILKTGLEMDNLLELMNKETWLTAQRAKELGFADEIMFDESNKLAASAGNSVLLPQNVIDKMRNEIKPKLNKEKNVDDEKAEILQARLNLLKIRRDNIV